MPDNAVRLPDAGLAIAVLAIVLGHSRLVRARKAQSGDSAAGGGGAWTCAEQDRREIDAKAGDGGRTTIAINLDAFASG